jgi:D-proline reductase (dithiol) PrdB
MAVRQLNWRVGQLEGNKMPEPVKYIQRTREYYSAQGFEKSYQWAQNDDIPWHSPRKPLNQCSVTFVTTAAPDGAIPRLSRTASSHRISEMPKVFRTDELAWDKNATHTDDIGSFIPLDALRTLADENVIAQLAPRFHFVPTDYSQRNSTESDAPAILQACQKDEVDIAILVPL